MWGIEGGQGFGDVGADGAGEGGGIGLGVKLRYLGTDVVDITIQVRLCLGEVIQVYDAGEVGVLKARLF